MSRLRRAISQAEGPTAFTDCPGPRTERGSRTEHGSPGARTRFARHGKQDKVVTVASGGVRAASWPMGIQRPWNWQKW